MEKLKEALNMVYTGEAKAALRLKIYADKAEAEGYSQVARLFRVIAYSEEIHGKRALKLLGIVKSTEENLAASFASETTVAEVHYRELMQQARAEGNDIQAKAFSQARDVEEQHASLYKSAMESMLEDRETEYYVCKVCGYVAENHAPDRCPVCDAPRDVFMRFDS